MFSNKLCHGHMIKWFNIQMKHIETDNIIRWLLWFDQLIALQPYVWISLLTEIAQFFSVFNLKPKRSPIGSLKKFASRDRDSVDFKRFSCRTKLKRRGKIWSMCRTVKVADWIVLTPLCEQAISSRSIAKRNFRCSCNKTTSCRLKWE